MRPLPGAAAARPDSIPTIFAEFDDIFGSIGDIFGFGGMFGGGRRRGGPQRGADLRYDLEITLRAVGRRRRNDDPDSSSRNLRDVHVARARRAGSSPTTCPQCRGTGQLRYQQGFFTVARTCGQCRGSGRVIANPCQTCRGAGRCRAAAQADGQDSAPASPPGNGCGLTGEGEAGRPGRPAGRPLRGHHGAGAFVLPPRRQRPRLRDPGELHDPRAGR